jgi:hypothetical protein
LFNEVILLTPFLISLIARTNTTADFRSYAPGIKWLLGPSLIADAEWNQIDGREIPGAIGAGLSSGSYQPGGDVLSVPPVRDVDPSARRRHFVLGYGAVQGDFSQQTAEWISDAPGALQAV